MAIERHVERLIQYGLQKELISYLDIEYTRNRLYEALHITHPEVSEQKENESAAETESDCSRYRHLSRPAEREDHGLLCPAAVRDCPSF